MTAIEHVRYAFIATGDNFNCHVRQLPSMHFEVSQLEQAVNVNTALLSSNTCAFESKLFDIYTNAKAFCTATAFMHGQERCSGTKASQFVQEWEH